MVVVRAGIVIGRNINEETLEIMKLLEQSSIVQPCSIHIQS